MNKLIQKILAFFYMLSRINWWKAWRLHNRKSDVVLWAIPCWPKFWRYNNAVMIADFVYLKYFTDNNIPYRIVLGGRIGKVTNANIFYSMSRLYNPYNLHNWAANLLCVVKELESQGNLVFAPHKEAVWWENKTYMQQRFVELGVNHPRTIVFEKGKEFDLSQLRLPVVYKEVHTSGSKGMQRIDTMEALQKVIAEKRSIGYYDFMIQELVDMRRDMRLIVIGDKIVSHYWRINHSDEWKPTSTSGGSSADFGNFPEQWRTSFLQTFKKLDITAGAFDITWQKDDINTEPLYLEVSPSYMPNPTPNEKYAGKSYGDFKKDIFCKNPYYKKVIDVLFEHRLMMTELYYQQVKARHAAK
jgi:hypothetical protein